MTQANIEKMVRSLISAHEDFCKFCSNQQACDDDTVDFQGQKTCVSGIIAHFNQTNGGTEK